MITSTKYDTIVQSRQGVDVVVPLKERPRHTLDFILVTTDTYGTEGVSFQVPATSQFLNSAQLTK